MAATARHYDTILSPVITEKTTLLSEQNKVVFKVANDATKDEIAAAVEELFSVKVIGISTMNPPRRSRRVGRFAGHRAQVKKAVVRLAEGNTFQLFPES